MPKSKNFAAKAAFATLTPPLQCVLQLSAEKHNHITHGAVTTRNLEAATPLRSANNELQNAMELRTQALHIAAICNSKTGWISTPKQNYFSSSDPHHDMSGYVRTYIWTYLEYILTFYLTYILAFNLAIYLTYILTFHLAGDPAFYLAFFRMKKQH